MLAVIGILIYPVVGCPHGPDGCLRFYPLTLAGIGLVIFGSLLLIIGIRPPAYARAMRQSPETPQLREPSMEGSVGIGGRKRSPPSDAAEPLIALVAVIVVGGLGAYAVAPIVSPSLFAPLPCVSYADGGQLSYHWHTQLSIYSGGMPSTIPADIGLTVLCAEPLHTHDTSGTIHIEPDLNRLYSIGDFFRVWGRSFDSPTQMFVNGTALSSPTLSQILYDQETISIHYTSFT